MMYKKMIFLICLGIFQNVCAVNWFGGQSDGLLVSCRKFVENSSKEDELVVDASSPAGDKNFELTVANLKKGFSFVQKVNIQDMMATVQIITEEAGCKRQGVVMALVSHSHHDMGQIVVTLPSKRTLSGIFVPLEPGGKACPTFYCVCRVGPDGVNIMQFLFDLPKDDVGFFVRTSLKSYRDFAAWRLSYGYARYSNCEVINEEVFVE